MSLQLGPNDVLQVSWYDTVDQKWIKIEIVIGDTQIENKDIWRYDLDIAIQDVLAEIEKQKVELNVNK